MAVFRKLQKNILGDLRDVLIIETIDICIDILYNHKEDTSKILKDVFHNFLNVDTNESFFMFNIKFYKKIVGETMGSPWGPAIATIFLCNFGNK